MQTNALTPYTQDQYLAEKASGERRSNGVKPLKRLRPWHRLAIAMHLDGRSNAEIASLVKKRQSTISIVLSDPLAQREIDRAQSAYEAEFNALYGKTVQALRSGLESQSTMAKLRAAQIFLKERERILGVDSSSRTAEDVIQEVLRRIPGVNIQVNVGGD